MAEKKETPKADTDDVIELSDKVSAKVTELLALVPNLDGAALVDKGKEIQALNDQLQALTDSLASD